MKIKPKPITRKELVEAAFEQGHERGMTQGALNERKRMDLEKQNQNHEASIKLVNAIGQTIHELAKILMSHNNHL